MSTTTTLFGSAEAQAARALVGGTTLGDNRNDLLKQILVATANRTGGTSGVAWGAITGTLLAQTDLAAALALLVPLTQFTGGGTVATGGFTLTVPATGTAALLGTANVFTAAQTITQGSVNAGILASTGYSLTGSNATNMIDLAGTWNTSGAPTAIKLNIIRTAAAATSLLLDLRQNDVSVFNVLPNSAGNVKVNLGLRGAFLSTLSDYATSFEGYFGVIIQQNSAGINCIGGNQLSIGLTTDLILGRKAAATLQLGLDAAGVTNQMLTAASRITSDGVGANLTLAGGNGRGGAGGSLIFSTYTTAGAATIGTLTTRLTLDTNGLLTFADAVNMVFNTTTGTKIGTASNQKLGFWGTTPITQPARIVGLMDNSGGMSGGNTIALVNGATDPTAAALTDTQNAISTLADKINQIEALLTASSGGVGLTA